MSQPHSDRRYCALAWALLVLTPVLAVSAVAIPWMQRSGELQESIAATEDQLLRYRRAVATLPSLRSELEHVNNNSDFKAFYFSAATPALAGAELQRKVQDIVSAAQGRLISTQSLPELKDEQPARVRLRTQIQGSTDTLIQVLYGLEEARPFLFVEQLSVRSTARPDQRPDQPEQAARGRPARRPVNEAGELTVRLDVFGFALPGGGG
jgi:general secretion pathway protein M